MTPHQAIDMAAAIVGGKGKLCAELGLNRQAVFNWKKTKVPLRRALQIESLTGGKVRLTDLRPDYASQSNDTQ